MNPVDSVIRPPLVVPFSSSKSKPAPLPKSDASTAAFCGV